MGVHLIPELPRLKAQGLLEPDAQFTSVEQMLDGLERTSSRLAATFNTPPLDVAALRTEWQAIREDARALQPGTLPSRETIGAVWAQLKNAAARQDRSVFETSSMLAVSAARGFPDGVRWLSASAMVGATPQAVLADTLLDTTRYLEECAGGSRVTRRASSGPTSPAAVISRRPRRSPSVWSVRSPPRGKRSCQNNENRQLRVRHFVFVLSSFRGPYLTRE